MFCCKSLVEHSFAKLIFPAIIYDLLESDKVEDNEAGHHSMRDRSSDIYKKSSVGISSSVANLILTENFSLILTSNPSGKVYTEAVEVLLNTLDMLRSITKYRFMSSTLHKPNERSLKKWKKNRSPKIDWKGIPFGVVLHFNGIEIAKSYIHTTAYISSLYYAEMYADNRLGGSGCTFEKITKGLFVNNSETVSQYDISGFGVPIESDSSYHREIELSNTPNTISRQALHFQDILSQCYKELNDDDGLDAVNALVDVHQFSSQEALIDDTDIMLSNHMTTTNQSQSLINLDTSMQLLQNSPSCSKMKISSGKCIQLDILKTK